MTAPPDRRRRSAELVSRLKSARRDVAPTPAAPLSAPRRFDFATLDEVKEIRFQRAAADRMGVGSPFFHLFEGRNGPVCRVEGRERLNFSSYDYLGLNGHPAVMEAAKAAIDEYGVSCGASRVVGGERPPHAALEAALADLHGVESALAFVSGHATNVSVIDALLERGDAVVADELAHNSILVGARLSGAARYNFPHNDYDALEKLLERVRAENRRVLIAVEGLYSMDGDTADLRRLVEIKSAFDAWLMVDEAHSVGVLGATGRGIAEEQGVDPGLVEIWMGTLSKTCAATGGYVAGAPELIEALKARAPGFVFSVGLPPALAAAARTAIGIMSREPSRVERLRRNGSHLREALAARGLDTGLSEGRAVAPVVLGDSATTAAAAHLAFEAGLLAPPILHPAVPERRARLRLFATSEHEPDQIERAADIIADAARRAPEVKARLFG